MVPSRRAWGMEDNIMKQVLNVNDNGRGVITTLVCDNSGKTSMKITGVIDKVTTDDGFYENQTIKILDVNDGVYSNCALIKADTNGGTYDNCEFDVLNANGGTYDNCIIGSAGLGATLKGGVYNNCEIRFATYDDKCVFNNCELHNCERMERNIFDSEVERIMESEEFEEAYERIMDMVYEMVDSFNK